MKAAAEDELRCFIGLPVAPDLGTELRAKIPGDIQNIRPIYIANYHLTLAFLGTITGECAATISQSLRDYLCCRPFQLPLVRIETFQPANNRFLVVTPDDDHPATDQLLRLRNEVVDALQAVRQSFDRKRFRPHITVGRSRARSLQCPTLEIHSLMPVSDVVLYQSAISDQQQRYLELYRVPLMSG